MEDQESEPKSERKRSSSTEQGEITELEILQERTIRRELRKKRAPGEDQVRNSGRELLSSLTSNESNSGQLSSSRKRLRSPDYDSFNISSNLKIYGHDQRGDEGRGSSSKEKRHRSSKQDPNRPHSSKDIQHRSSKHETEPASSADERNAASREKFKQISSSSRDRGSTRDESERLSSRDIRHLSSRDESRKKSSRDRRHRSSRDESERRSSKSPGGPTSGSSSREGGEEDASHHFSRGDSNHSSPKTERHPSYRDRQVEPGRSSRDTSSRGGDDDTDRSGVSALEKARREVEELRKQIQAKKRAGGSQETTARG